jgi:hypothetical protein
VTTAHQLHWFECDVHLLWPTFEFSASCLDVCVINKNTTGLNKCLGGQQVCPVPHHTNWPQHLCHAVVKAASHVPSGGVSPEAI